MYRNKGNKQFDFAMRKRRFYTKDNVYTDRFHYKKKPDQIVVQSGGVNANPWSEEAKEVERKKQLSLAANRLLSKLKNWNSEKGGEQNTSGSEEQMENGRAKETSGNVAGESFKGESESNAKRGELTAHRVSYNRGGKSSDSFDKVSCANRHRHKSKLNKLANRSGVQGQRKQKKIGRGLIGELMTMPKDNFKKVLIDPKINPKIERGMAQIVKENRLVLAQQFRKLAESKMNDREKFVCSEFVNDVGSLIDPDLAINVCQLPPELIKQIGAIFQLDFESGETMPDPSSEVNLCDDNSGTDDCQDGTAVQSNTASPKSSMICSEWTPIEDSSDEIYISNVKMPGGTGQGRSNGVEMHEQITSNRSVGDFNEWTPVTDSCDEIYVETKSSAPRHGVVLGKGRSNTNGDRTLIEESQSVLTQSAERSFDDSRWIPPCGSSSSSIYVKSDANEPDRGGMCVNSDQRIEKLVAESQNDSTSKSGEHCRSSSDVYVKTEANESDGIAASADEESTASGKLKLAPTDGASNDVYAKCEAIARDRSFEGRSREKDDRSIGTLTPDSQSVLTQSAVPNSKWTPTNGSCDIYVKTEGSDQVRSRKECEVESNAFRYNSGCVARNGRLELRIKQEVIDDDDDDDDGTESTSVASLRELQDGVKKAEELATKSQIGCRNGGERSVEVQTSINLMEVDDWEAFETDSEEDLINEVKMVDQLIHRLNQRRFWLFLRLLGRRQGDPGGRLAEMLANGGDANALTETRERRIWTRSRSKGAKRKHCDGFGQHKKQRSGGKNAELTITIGVNEKTAAKDSRELIGSNESPESEVESNYAKTRKAKDNLNFHLKIQ